MAFVRRKPSKGKRYYYYQWVWNYREDGRHKQKVLAHLGPHPTPEAAIAHHLGWLAFYGWIEEWRESFTYGEDAVEGMTAEVIEAGIEGGVLSSKRREARRMKAELLYPEGEDADIAGQDFEYVGEVYEFMCGRPLGEGEVPDSQTADVALEECREALKKLKEYKANSYCYRDSLEVDLEYEDWELNWELRRDLAQKILAYHRVESAAYRAEEAKMERYRARLDNLLAVYEKYGGEEK